MADGTYYLFANSGGCPQNQLDASRLFAYLDANGYRYTASPEEADFIFVNGCSYRSEKEDESCAAVRELGRRAKPGARIVVTGCLPKIAPLRIAAFTGRHIVLPAADLHRIEELIPPRYAAWEGTMANRIPDVLFRYHKPFRRCLAGALAAVRSRLSLPARHHFDAMFMYDHSARTFVVRVGEGCLGHCAYCAIRLSRGELKSRPVGSVLRDVRTGIALGHDEILLTATELAAYGRDLGTDLAALLERILALPGRFDLLLFYANPRWLIDRWERLEPLFASGRIHFVHLSLNGCSDKVLGRMGRGYTLHEFGALVRNIRRVSPTTVLQTQVMVGFPGETDEDFAAVRSFLRTTYIHNVQVHAYDLRPGTPAASMHDQVPVATRRKRRRTLYRQTLLAKLRFDLAYCLDFLFPLPWGRR